MERLITRVTTKGQVTIPANLRKALHIKSGDYLAISREGDRLVAEVLGNKRPKAGIIDQTAGMWKERSLNLEELRRMDEIRLRRLGIE